MFTSSIYSKSIMSFATTILLFLFVHSASATPFFFDYKKNRVDFSQWQYEGVTSLAVDPSINHYTWTVQVGEGPYDQIRIHRYVQEEHNFLKRPYRRAPDSRKVLFILNGTWGQEGDEPLEEFDSYFFPTNGYDLWTMDYRTAFVPNIAYDEFETLGKQEELLTTADWTYGAFREDIKTAVDFAKRIARTKKVFMAGRSRGGQQAFIYAAKYERDLKGIIGLDGGPIYRAEQNPDAQQPQAAYEGALAALASGATGAELLNEVANYENGRLVGTLPNVTAQIGEPLPDESELPFGPVPDGSAIDSLSDLLAYQTYFLGLPGFDIGLPGLLTNVYTPYPGGEGETYMDKSVLQVGLSNYSRYWPFVQNLENTFLTGYANNPYLDYDDTQDVTVPVMHFVGNFTCPFGSCLGLDRPFSTGSDDFSVKFLPGFGHLDVYYGTHAQDEVKEPMLEWMNNRL